MVGQFKPEVSLLDSAFSKRKKRSCRVSLPICKITLKTNTPPSEAYPRQLVTWGNHIRKKRLDLGFFQKDVALILQVNKNTINNLENNHTEPELTHLPKIIIFLGYAPFFGSCHKMGAKITRCRKYLGLNQRAFAKLIGVDPTTIQRWENSQSKSMNNHLEKINRVFLS